MNAAKISTWIIVMLILTYSSFAVFTPQGDIDLRNRYDIVNGSYIYASYFIGDGAGLTGITVAVVNATNAVNATFAINATNAVYATNASYVENATRADLWDDLDTPLNFTTVGTIGISEYLGSLLNVSSTWFTDAVGTTVNATTFYQNGEALLGVSFNSSSSIVELGFNTTAELDNWYILQSNEGTLNVSEADKWDGLDSPTDITAVGTLTSLTLSGNINIAGNSIENYFGSGCIGQFVYDIGDDGTIYCADQAFVSGSSYIIVNSTYGLFFNATEALAALKVNGSVYADNWDGLADPSDINAGDITDDGTYLKDLVDDTTPQLGANLDANGFNISIDVNNFLCLDSGCTAYITFNSTHVITHAP